MATCSVEKMALVWCESGFDLSTFHLLRIALRIQCDTLIVLVATDAVAMVANSLAVSVVVSVIVAVVVVDVDVVVASVVVVDDVVVVSSAFESDARGALNARVK